MHVSKTCFLTRTVSYLYVKCMCGCEAAVLQHCVDMLGEDECVWTERVPPERWSPDVRHVLHLTQPVELQLLTHFFNTVDETADQNQECVN